MVPVLWFASTRPSFQTYYGNTLSQPLAIGNYAFARWARPPVNLQGLLYYETVMGFYFFCWEFFFRGFLLFGLAKLKFINQAGAVFVQALPFTLLHWSLIQSASKPPLEIASAFFGGLILGALAVRAKSFFYGFLIHWIVALGLDMFFIVPILARH
jgi:membrane protease YdiL (CAAX protease family)